MTFVNNYTPESPISDGELYGPELYDLNFVLPIPPQLSTDKLRLVPFIPRAHAATYFDGVHGHESMFKHMPSALEHPVELLRLVERFRRDRNAVIFAAIDTTRPDANHPEWEGSLAGMFGLWGTNKEMLVAGISLAIVLPAFQRTHVSSHAVGLLLKARFPKGPMVYISSPMNAPSNSLVERMGFKLEGVMRWKFVLPMVEGYSKPGKEARVAGSGNSLLGRDSNEWALCWDDWEEGGRELVEHAFARAT